MNVETYWAITAGFVPEIIKRRFWWALIPMRLQRHYSSLKQLQHERKIQTKRHTQADEEKVSILRRKQFPTYVHKNHRRNEGGKKKIKTNTHKK